MGHDKSNCPNIGSRPDGAGGAAGLAMMARAGGRHKIRASQVLGLEDFEPAGATEAPMWILGSGALYHMTGDAEVLSNIQGYPFVDITLENDTLYTATTWGLAHTTVRGIDGPTVLDLKKVLHVPVLGSSLFSVHKASEHGFTT